MASSDNDNTRLDEAARAGWLYFIAGHTQDEIAKTLKISRASAQRLSHPGILSQTPQPLVASCPAE